MRVLRENAGWLGLLISVTLGAVTLYARATLAGTEQELAIVRDRLSQHIEMQNRQMETAARREAMTQRKLDAICRALPNATCPLGTE